PPPRIAQATAAAKAAPSPAAAPRVHKPRFILFSALALGLFVLGVGGGWYTVLLWPRSQLASDTDAAQEQHAPPAAITPAQPAAANSSTNVTDLAYGDALVREGRYDRALAVYQGLDTGAAVPARDTLRYRIGLCQEGLGRWDPAMILYRDLASKVENPA